MPWEDYFNYYPDYYYYDNTAAIILLICALVLTIIIAIAFLPIRRKQSASAVMRGAHSFFSFNVFWVEKLIKFIFIFIAALLFCAGIYCMITISVLVGLGLLVSILFVRLLFESFYVMLSIREQLVQINSKTPDFKVSHEKQAPMATEKAAPVSNNVNAAAEAPAVVCKNCGAKLSPDSKFCVSCGNSVE